ncbi:RNA polymerase sporulation sigma factor SigK [Desulfofundulus thermobenzoicus]|uniref:RNA polymerase sigma factor n=1 Tax=Desulfofundulus thermobenzoicus TaxID=29376 RepID=A0A6N7IPY2_9FIRM|nr:RNA polymerase sporulation sigma factor SigK [Desulfofundulus thermobenzoicus]MQL52040.1 RNA polymerase sporulation sigma factor SigK [Desulfofundulus thermobenzoicus]HHW42294.1 RNA polymerase sporulation sigma factor SigK [Desulfotomaculum sp.]
MVPGLWALAVLSVINGLVILICHVAGNSFPKPLSEEEEAFYLGKMMAGDESARRVLIERNLRLVAHIIKKFEHSGEDFDDLISIGTIGLIKAVDTYNPEKATRLATYASRCIENEILMHLRARKKVRVELSLYDPIGMDKEGNEITFMDVLGTEPEVVSETVAGHLEQDCLWQHLQQLPPQERKVLVLRFGLKDGARRTQREIARYLGISRSYVSRIEKRALNRLTERLALQAGR